MKIEKRYIDGSYLNSNPDWDRKDAAWKAKQVFQILEDHKIEPSLVCEVGCGSGDILRSLEGVLPKARLVGYDISPQLEKFWQNNNKDINCRIEYNLGDFHRLNNRRYDVLLMLDVFEHVRDPFTFLEDSLEHANKFIFHVPIDLSAISVARKAPLLNVRRSVGHLHSYTKDLALETLVDCGYKIIDWRYTGASLNMPNKSLKTNLARFPRLIAGMLNKDWAVRVFGGETLLVLAEEDTK